MRISRRIVTSWALFEAVRIGIYGYSIHNSPIAEGLPTYEVHTSLMSLNSWGEIMMFTSVIMLILILTTRSIFVTKVALTLAFTISVAWSFAFIVVAFTEPLALKYGWINWLALALANILAIKLPIIEPLEMNEVTRVDAVKRVDDGSKYS